MLYKGYSSPSLEKIVIQSEKNVKSALGKDKSLQQSAIKREVITQTVVKEIIKHETTACPPLLNGSVRLLNKLREGERVGDSSSFFDGEGSEASEVTTQDLIDNDAEIVRMYNDLAEKHNALVDFENSKEN